MCEKCDIGRKEFEKVRDLAWSECEKVEDPAWMEFKKIEKDCNDNNHDCNCRECDL